MLNFCFYSETFESMTFQVWAKVVVLYMESIRSVRECSKPF